MQKIVFFIILFFTLSLKAFFIKKNSYLSSESHIEYGMSLGYGFYDYSNDIFYEGVNAKKIERLCPAFDVFFVYKVNPTFAMQVDYFQSIKEPYAKNLTGVDSKKNVKIWSNGLSLGFRFLLNEYNPKIYSLVGLSYISSLSSYNDVFHIVNPSQSLTSMIALGSSMKLSDSFNLVLETRFHFQSKRNPKIWYNSLGIKYEVLNSKRSYQKPKDMDKNKTNRGLIELAFFDMSRIKTKVHEVFSSGPIRLFWGGSVRLSRGIIASYKHIFLNYDSGFSWNMGLNSASWFSGRDKQAFNSISFLLFDLNYLLINKQALDLELNFSLANPSYLTKNKLDGFKLGGHFAFYDSLGIKLSLGKQKKWNFNFTIAHFSNGNLLPQNPGIWIPLMFGIGTKV